MNKISYADPGDVGLIYTDTNGNYHILALSRDQHEVLNIFVGCLTKSQPAIICDNYEVIIREKK